MEKQIPYEDTYLTIKNYKEPLTKIPKGKGFGYYGTLLSTVDGQSVQCHVCGKLFSNLGVHARQAHKLPEREYRERFDIARTTALISENERMRTKQQTLEWLQKMTDKEKEIWKEKQRLLLKEGRKLRGKYQPELSLETKNKRGTCPTQLLEKIREVSKKIGHIPSKFEFICETETQRYIHLIYKVFGSWSKALKILGMTPRLSVNGGNRVGRYNDDELLELLVIFTQENNKIPTYTDFRRGLLPSYKVYQGHFGTIENARQMADVYKYLNK